MADPFHLPDLPNAGYATHREKQLTDATMQFIREIERDRFRLLTIVLEGREKWRTVAQSIWRGLRIGEHHDLLDSIFAYLELMAVPPRVQAALLRAQKNPAKWREIMRFCYQHIEREREQVRLLQKFSPYGN